MARVNRPNAAQNYRTPPDLLGACERRFGRITFDLACTVADCVAPVGFCHDEGDDALALDWGAILDVDDLGYCNPPWRQAGQYAAKAAACGRQVLLNCQLAPDATWYERHVHPFARVYALIPRVPYLNPDGTPAFVDARGKPLGVNRPVMIAAYGFGLTPGLEPWRWRE